MCVCVCVCVCSVRSNSLDPMDCSLPGFSVHGILQATNTGVDYHFLLQGIFQPRNRTHVSFICRWMLPRGYSRCFLCSSNPSDYKIQGSQIPARSPCLMLPFEFRMLPTSSTSTLCSYPPPLPSFIRLLSRGSSR